MFTTEMGDQGINTVLAVMFALYSLYCVSNMLIRLQRCWWQRYVGDSFKILVNPYIGDFYNAKNRSPLF